ncbi:DUF6447 family protein [Nitrincola alkalilacustris]|uniref:DUF6447 family protein n=1 Tax=Nitrincola alkalilacustris TaxID=1571224 RepID=UPI00124E01CC|nr:DUF6447 family protein [Nitrincola alkalilacustris]
METKDTVKINDKEYKLADLSEDAKAQLTNLRVCDAELQRLKAQIAIVETAKAAYGRALTEELSKIAN